MTGMEIVELDWRIALQSAFFAWWGAGAWRIGRWSGGRQVNRRVEVQPRHLKKNFHRFLKNH